MITDAVLHEVLRSIGTFRADACLDRGRQRGQHQFQIDANFTGCYACEMAEIFYPACKKRFEGNNLELFTTHAAAMAPGAGAVACLSGEIGSVGGPFGGIAGSAPGSVLGKIVGWLGADQFRRYPFCGRIFKT